MKKITFVLASRNAHKIAELKKLLAEKLDFPFELLSLDDIGHEGDIEEDGASFEENSLIKASVPAKLGYLGIADDSGLSVDALDGAPGIYSARYAGEPCDNNANNEKLLRELDGLPAEKRGAAFVCTLTLALPDNTHITARGECRGRIINTPTGNGGFGYDPLFFYEPLGKTFAELAPEEKNKVSHRANAIALFAKKLNGYFSIKSEETDDR